MTIGQAELEVLGKRLLGRFVECLSKMLDIDMGSYELVLCDESPRLKEPIADVVAP